MAEEKDVDLYAELRKTLEAPEESEVKKTPGASPEKPKEEVVTPKVETKENENAELTDEDISKLSPRAQKRIREQAAEIKRLADEAVKTPESPKKEDKPDSPKFNNVKEFLSAVEDEPSRNLLEKFYQVIKSETSTVLAPIEKQNNEAKFNEEFGKYEKIEGVADYKDDLRKTFMRNPNQSLKALVGEVVTDLQLNKIKPIEKTPSTPSREGKIDLEGKSKDELYDLLESTR
jgi:hypothetical protein